MKGYLAWKEDISIECVNNRALFLYVKKNGEVKRSLLNSTGKEIIDAIDGTRTFEMVIEYFCNKYKENEDEIKKKIVTFLKELQNKSDISLVQCKSPTKKKIVTNRTKLMPKVASLELTNRCNIRCLHCYGNFESCNNITMPIDGVKKVLNDLNEMQAYIIELTGGECLMHPDFRDILSYALSLNFVHISILTNGIALTEEIINLIVKNKDRVFVQIDLHSLDDTYLQWFTGVKNTLDIIKRNITKLAESNVRLRIATIVTKRNIDEMYSIAEWVYNLGIRTYAPAFSVELGRAKEVDDDVLLNDEEHLQKFMDNIVKINNDFGAIVKMKNEFGFQDTYNCGCLSSHVTIDANGRIKICTMDTLKYIKSDFGNAFKESIRKIYEEKQELIAEFSNTMAPIANSEECKHCENATFCSSCLLRAFISAKEKGNQCEWYKKRLGNNIKKVLFSE